MDTRPKAYYQTLGGNTLVILAQDAATAQRLSVFCRPAQYRDNRLKAISHYGDSIFTMDNFRKLRKKWIEQTVRTALQGKKKGLPLLRELCKIAQKEFQDTFQEQFIVSLPKRARREKRLTFAFPENVSVFPYGKGLPRNKNQFVLSQEAENIEAALDPDYYVSPIKDFLSIHENFS